MGDVDTYFHEILPFTADLKPFFFFVTKFLYELRSSCTNSVSQSVRGVTVYYICLKLNNLKHFVLGCKTYFTVTLSPYMLFSYIKEAGKFLGGRGQYY